MLRVGSVPREEPAPAKSPFSCGYLVASLTLSSSVMCSMVPGTSGDCRTRNNQWEIDQSMVTKTVV